MQGFEHRSYCYLAPDLGQISSLFPALVYSNENGTNLRRQQHMMHGGKFENLIV